MITLTRELSCILKSRVSVIMLFKWISLLCLGRLTSSQTIGNDEKHQVVIVGAGVSGFAAAAALLDRNFTDFVVLEASDKVGGRIHTVEFGGVAIDKGAEFVHGERDNAVFQLLREHNLLHLLSSYSPLMSSDKQLFCDISGNQYNSTLVNSVIDQGREVLMGDYGGSNGSVAAYFYPKLEELLSANSVDRDLGEAIRHLLTQSECSYTAADSLEQMGTRGEARYIENEGDQMWKWKPGTQGYKTIFDILSRKYPDPSKALSVMEKIVFLKEVQLIKRYNDSSEVVLSCADGSSYRADHVIVTVSLGVLKKHAEEMFQPPLPQNMTDAIQTLGFGCVGKVFLLFPTRWWPSNITSIIPLFNQKQLEDFRKNSTSGYWTGDSTGFYPVMNNERMLCAWFAGNTCRIMESLSDEQVIDGQLELLNAVAGHQFNIPRPGAILRTNWASYNYTLGAYSFNTVDSDPLNITRPNIFEPLMYRNKPVVMFAGEATIDHYWSTVHGALASGRREANRFLNYIHEQHK